MHRGRWWRSSRAGEPLLLILGAELALSRCRVAAIYAEHPAAHPAGEGLYLLTAYLALLHESYLSVQV